MRPPDLTLDLDVDQGVSRVIAAIPYRYTGAQPGRPRIIKQDHNLSARIYRSLQICARNDCASAYFAADE